MITDKKIQMVTDIILHGSFKGLFQKSLCERGCLRSSVEHEFYAKSVIICAIANKVS